MEEKKITVLVFIILPVKKKIMNSSLIVKDQDKVNKLFLLNIKLIRQ